MPLTDRKPRVAGADWKRDCACAWVDAKAINTAASAAAFVTFTGTLLAKGLRRRAALLDADGRPRLRHRGGGRTGRAVQIAGGLQRNGPRLREVGVRRHHLRERA